MGIFNEKLDRLMGNKKQKKAAEFLAEMVSDDKQEETAPSYKLAQGKANGFVQVSLTDESGETTHSTIKIYGATQNLAGVMTAADKRKLDAVPSAFPQVHKVKFNSLTYDGTGLFSATVNFADIGISEGLPDSFENIYIVPMYGNFSPNSDNFNILPVTLLPLRELLLMGEYMFRFIDSTSDDFVQYKQVVITALSRYNSEDEFNEFIYTGLKMEMFDVSYENDIK